MKTFLSTAIALGVTMAALADDVRITSAVADLVKMAQAQVSPAVLESFVANSPVAYSPNPDEILYMKKQGVPDEVVAAIRQWDRKKFPVDDSTFQIFQNIAASKVLPLPTSTARSGYVASSGANPSAASTAADRSRR